MLINNDALANAFQLLAATARDFASRARPCLGATLKPALYSRGNFSEQMLGFRKFGDFLRAAQAAGYVQLRPTPGGDIGVWPASVPIEGLPGQALSASPPSTSQELSPSRPGPSSSIRIRQDLWNAFNSFSAKWVYDPLMDVAFKDADAAGAWTMPGAHRPNLIQIPGSQERVVEWMHSFAGMQDPETGSHLSAALNGDAGPYQFNNEVRSRDLLRSWSHFHIQQVRAAIDAWAAANGVQPKNIVVPRYSPMHSTIRVRTPSPTSPVTSEAVHRPPVSIPDATQTSQPIPALLTNRLEAVVDDLIDDLIQLRGLLQVVRSKQP